MAQNSPTYVIRGTLDWAKVLGKPRLNTYTEENEWSVDVTPNEEGRAIIKKAGITDKLRDPKDNDSRKETFLSFRQKELRKDKSGNMVANQPIKVVDAGGNKWDETKMIGNGTIADVKFTVKDNGKGRPKGVYIQAIRVLQHVPYEVQEFAPLSSDDEYFAGSEGSPAEESRDRGSLEVDTKGEAGNPDDLYDDIPF